LYLDQEHKLLKGSYSITQRGLKNQFEIDGSMKVAYNKNQWYILQNKQKLKKEKFVETCNCKGGGRIYLINNEY